MWKGMPVFKTVFDINIYQMILWDVKPKTILEIGSGTGSSAVWLADLVKNYGLDTYIYSMDIKKSNLKSDRVTFLEGNSSNLGDSFSPEFLRTFPRPMLVIEDAHNYVLEVMQYLHPFLKPGDYLVLEDSDSKDHSIATFMKENRDEYKVDTYYTDYFGINATCSVNSIFVRQ